MKRGYYSFTDFKYGLNVTNLDNSIETCADFKNARHSYVVEILEYVCKQLKMVCSKKMKEQNLHTTC